MTIMNPTSKIRNRKDEYYFRSIFIHGIYTTILFLSASNAYAMSIALPLRTRVLMAFEQQTFLFVLFSYIVAGVIMLMMNKKSPEKYMWSFKRININFLLIIVSFFTAMMFLDCGLMGFTSVILRLLITPEFIILALLVYILPLITGIFLWKKLRLNKTKSFKRLIIYLILTPTIPLMPLCIIGSGLQSMLSGGF